VTVQNSATGEFTLPHISKSYRTGSAHFIAMVFLPSLHGEVPESRSRESALAEDPATTATRPVNCDDFLGLTGLP
jgi:hypothetical protein